MKEHQMNSPSSIVTFLARLTLLCICLGSEHAAAGKGKVPVYMPFPVPVPMPVPSGGGGGGGGGSHQSHTGNKFHHHHHLHHSGAGEADGEVKKIYLLQPVEAPSKQQQRQPVVVYNSPHPVVEQQPIHHHQQQQIDLSQPQFQQQNLYAPKGQPAPANEMKILPIVVIPPIAPMPPIQIHSAHQSGHQTNAPRMTLSPQFNNYLVSGRDEPAEKRSQTRHANDLYQDHKSFGDYGNFAGATMYRRAESRPRYRPRARSHISYDYLASRQAGGRGNRIQDDYGDDYDYTPSSWSARRSSRGFVGRRAPRSRESDYKLGANSIKDVIDYQTVFDDEPPMEVGPESRGDSGTSSNNRASRLIINGRNVNLDSIEEHADKSDYLDNQYTSASRARATMLNDKERPSDHQPRLANEIISYDRDYPAPNDEPQSRLSIKYTSSSLSPTNGGSGGSTGKRGYIDDRELMQSDDEWRFESVNSISHAILQQNNATQTNSTTANKSPKSGG